LFGRYIHPDISDSGVQHKKNSGQIIFSSTFFQKILHAVPSVIGFFRHAKGESGRAGSH
jgi:hypothetical protein